MTMNNLFAESNNTATTNGRGLAGTAQLTAIASELANRTIAELNESIDEYMELFKASQKDHNAMDSLVDAFVDFDEVDYDFIYQLDMAVVDGMLKSQQSKRSRAKSKAMTMDNYKSMMTAAIAEKIIRIATGKAKNAVGVRRNTGSVSFNEDELEVLKADQEQLKKELRNIQSKKSIMKSKADFDESSERWLALLEAEEQLKSIRVSSRGARVVEVDTTKEKLKEAFEGINLEDINNMKAADSKVLLAKLAELISK
jgi:hypothetical protein